MPNVLADNRYEETHAVVVYDPTDPREPLIISLMLNFVTNYLPVRNTSIREYEDEYISHIITTSENPAWEPSESTFFNQEEAMNDFSGQVIDRETVARIWRIINYISMSCIFDAVYFTGDYNFFDALNSKVNVEHVGISKGKHGFNN